MPKPLRLGACLSVAKRRQLALDWVGRQGGGRAMLGREVRCAPRVPAYVVSIKAGGRSVSERRWWSLPPGNLCYHIVAEVDDDVCSSSSWHELLPPASI